MKIGFCHNNDPANLGDLVCSPIDYFNWEGHTKQRLDLFAPLEAFANCDAIIFGGGGLLHPGLQDRLKFLLEFCRFTGKKAIAWGLGSNQHGTTRLEHPDWLEGFDLLGLREFSNLGSAQRVPCVSCMAPEFDQPARCVGFDKVLYRHRASKSTVSPTAGTPSRVNCPCSGDRLYSFERAIRFLRLGASVITDTFHGAYWSLLLGRRVALLEPFSSRFWSFGFPIAVCDRDNWNFASPTAAPENYLENCRGLNRGFKAQVDRLLAE
jgi:hypothetical protein